MDFIKNNIDVEKSVILETQSFHKYTQSSFISLFYKNKYKPSFFYKLKINFFFLVYFESCFFYEWSWWKAKTWGSSLKRMNFWRFFLDLCVKSQYSAIASVLINSLKIRQISHDDDDFKVVVSVREIGALSTILAFAALNFDNIHIIMSCFTYKQIHAQ